MSQLNCPPCDFQLARVTSVSSNSIKFFFFARYYGIPDNQRIIDPRKGPVKRTAAAGRLPKIDSRDGSSSVKSSPGPQESKSTVQPRGFSSAEYARTKHA